MIRSLATFLFALLLSLLAVALLWMGRMPLGVPGEWTWGRVPEMAVSEVLLGGIWLLVAAGIYAGVVWNGAGRVESASRVRLGLWLAGLVLAGFGWLFAVQLTPPEGYGIEKSAYVLYYQASSGYFTEARTREESLKEYLANYETDIQSPEVSRRVLHHGTHPPGLVIGYRGLIRLCESSPGFVDVVLKTQPDSVERMFRDIALRTKSRQHPLRDSDRAVIWLAALLTQFAGALAVVPLFFLGRGIAAPRSAWIASAFWPLVPALAVFLPKSDVLYALFGTLFLAGWWSGWRRKCWLRCFLAGAVFWLGMMFSLAVLPVAFLAGLLVIWDVWFSEDPEPLSARIKRGSPLIFSGLLGVLIPAVLVSGFTRMNLFAVWWQNYQNHAEFYQHFPRSYWPWFGANAVETFFAVGAPICVLTAAAVHRQWKDRKTAPISSWGPYVAFLAMMAVLWISGKNRGEAARLWLVVFPYFVWISARFWDRSETESAGPADRRWLVLSLLALQMLICWSIVLQIHGFPLPL